MQQPPSPPSADWAPPPPASSDATKFFNGGISNAGFGKVRKALDPFSAALQAGQHGWIDTVRANWINGEPKDDQKTAAKSLVRLGLSSANASEMAPAGHVAPAALLAAMSAVENGVGLTAAQVNVLARFNSAIDAAMDAGFEQGDQIYRNASKVTAGIFAVALAIWGGIILHENLALAALVGVIAVPIAPVAKDLTSSLQAAVKALKAT